MAQVIQGVEKAINATVGDAKQRQMQQFTLEQNNKTPLTSYFGAKIAETDIALRAGNRGPTLLEDFHNREKISHFDHERIPERAVHARGAGAFGEFKLHTPLTGLTTAKILTDTSKVTPAFVRFSTVGGSRGSADTVRDPRGFAARLYTDEGNWDIVGNNMPVCVTSALCARCCAYSQILHSGRHQVPRLDPRRQAGAPQRNPTGPNRP